jgi:hypothetical protein
MCDGAAFTNLISLLDKSPYKTLNDSTSALIVDGIVTEPHPCVHGNCALRNLILVRLDANVMIYSRSEPLFAPKVLFGRLHADVAK